MKRMPAIRLVQPGRSADAGRRPARHQRSVSDTEAASSTATVA